MASAAQPQVVWRPGSAPQRALLACPVFEVFFGGARGGGKTDGVLGEWAQHASEHGANAIGLMVRRARIQLTETFERAKVLFLPIGAKFTEQPMRCVMPNGARLNFAYLERDADADNYQGHSYTRVYVEEAGTFPSSAPILKLIATLRSGAGVPCRMRLTGNPGGPGHQWVKARYVNPAPGGFQIIRDEDTGKERVYIPSRVSDNTFLGEDYINNLKLVGNETLVRAWLTGDFSVVAGAFFDAWSTERHVIKPFSIPASWGKFGSFDWGSAKPFTMQWWAVSDGNPLPDGRLYQKGSIILYREWYGAQTDRSGATVPNVGLRLTTEAIAEGIKLRENREKIDYRVADPACWKTDGGPSQAEVMFSTHGILFRRADNSRVSGWTQMRDRMVGQDDEPMMYVFNICPDFIRTVPALQHDQNKPEDLDSDGEDHSADAARYAAMSRPWTRTPEVAGPVRGLTGMTMNEAFKLANPRGRSGSRMRI